jgi:glucose-6-phosphate isomerase
VSEGIMSDLTRSPEWQALATHARSLARIRLGELFDQDKGRAKRFTAGAVGITLDYSKQLLTNRTRELLLELARAANLQGWTGRLFDGERVNFTEGLPALHTALRTGDRDLVAGAAGDVGSLVGDALDLIGQFTTSLRNGQWTGHSGKPVSDVVALGIGGSQLGPQLVCRALGHLAAPQPQLHFLANADGAALDALLARLNPATTLFLIVSKSFSTPETLLNARAAREWYLASGAPQDLLSRHFVAISANADAVGQAGFDTRAMLPFWDWVGGRYSLWSAVGLPIAIAIGIDGFQALLAGANAMDEHFRSAPEAENLPVLMALTEIWNVNFLGHRSRAVIPYSDALADLPAYLQQLETESNGKSTDRDGAPVDYATAPVVWGAVGTTAQHAVFQALHQGTATVPVDFIGIEHHPTKRRTHSRMLHANMLAQSAALMRGKTLKERQEELTRSGRGAEEVARLAAHQTYPGNRPSSTILIDRLEPARLGALIALYEHKVFVESVIWRINAFDQWGVEWGKRLAGDIERALAGDMAAALPDASTASLAAQLRE